MKSRFRTFNIYLLLILLGVGFLTACKNKEEEEKKKAVIRLHLEVDPNVVRRSSPVPILRSSPILINVADDFIVHEGYIETATLVDSPGGGYAISLTYDQSGAWTLQNVTSGALGKHVAVYAQFYPEPRWLAAPLLTRPITNGVFNFTPDATREEAQHIVDGVNYVIKKRKDQSYWKD